MTTPRGRVDGERITPFSRPSEAVSEQGSTLLKQWAVIELSNGACVLVGERPGSLTWRRSTPITEFLATERVMVTSSGRCYRLDGPPADETDEADVIRPLLYEYGIRTADNVTAPYWTVMVSARKPA
jgi:hypothetical protein